MHKLQVFLFMIGTVVPHSAVAQIPENFKRENLVAWCIVPFDARNRSPLERAKMLRAEGLKRCAYDWREHHAATFEDEIVQYKNHGIEFFAFWDQHGAAFELFKKRQLTPQIWKTLTPAPSGKDEKEKIASAVTAMLPIVERTKQLGCKLGLYNHGGWGGEPKSLVAVCKALRTKGHDHVGIVYNFHHGHGHIKDFKESLELMMPYLLSVNLNGMVDLSQPKFKGQRTEKKILPIGAGDQERAMIQTLIDCKYAGPIGILGHVANRDVADVLRENLEGLEWILGQRERPVWLTRSDGSPTKPEKIIKKRRTGTKTSDKYISSKGAIRCQPKKKLVEFAVNV